MEAQYDLMDFNNGFITGYPAGSDITILHTMYFRPKKIEKNNKTTWTDDCLAIIFRDNITGQKKVEYIYKPVYEYYMIADSDDKKEYPREFIEKDKVVPVQVVHREIEKDIAKRSGNTEFFYNNIQNRDRYNNRKLHKVPDVFNSDTPLEDFYRRKFSEVYKNEPYSLHKAYFDIEVDGKYQAGDFPEPGECPINMISLYDDDTNTVYTVALRNLENPLIDEFESQYEKDRNGFITNIHDEIIRYLGGPKACARLGVSNFKGIGNENPLTLKVEFFDDELEMITMIFRLIHKISPDFLLAWNMPFDIPYTIQRVINLGADPAEVLTDPDFRIKECYYYEDQRNSNVPAERSDYAFISGKVVFKDQLGLFAQIRKAQINKFGKLSLDNLGTLIAKVTKYDYSHITPDISKLPYLNYYIFFIYNILDTIVQKCIEYKTKDVEHIFMKGLVNNTSYHKCNKQSIFLSNILCNEYYKHGYIIGNNVNKWNEKPVEKYVGALVGDPDNIDKSVLNKINGIPTMVVDNMADEDFKALYPSETMEHNISASTQIGFIVMDTKIYDNEDFTNNPRYCRSGEFLENFMCASMVEFSKRYLGLSGFKEFILFDLPNALSTFTVFRDKKNNVPVRPVNHNGLICPVTFNRTVSSPVKFERDNPDYGELLQLVKENIKG